MSQPFLIFSACADTQKQRCGGADAGPELRLDSGNPMAAGYEGNSVPEAAGCDPSLCQRLPDAVMARLVDVHWLQGSLPGGKK